MEHSAGWERAKRVVDLIAGLSVIATMVFIALQWLEMHTGASDTFDLAVAAKAQADAAKSQADNTKTIAEAAKSQAVNTETLARAAVSQVAEINASVKSSHSLVKTLRDTLKSSEEQFSVEQRPYIWFNSDTPVIQTGQIITWNVNYENYGRSPAFKLHRLNRETEVHGGYTDDKQPRVLQKLKRRANVKCGGSHHLFDPKFVHRQSSAVA